MTSTYALAELNTRAVAAAISVASSFGLRCEDPVLLKQTYNAVIHLRPAPVVARVATVTAQVRPDVKARIEGELALATFLAERNAPVVPPSEIIPPGPHQRDGLWMSFWKHIPHEQGQRPKPAAVARPLSSLHETLRDYAGNLPPLATTLDDVRRLVEGLARSNGVAAEDLALMQREIAHLDERMTRPRGPVQALHGDAHGGNMLVTSAGPIWTDFEEACVGPVAWDLACLTYLSPEPDKLLERYGTPPGREELAPYVDARWLQAAAWTSCLALYMPERRPYAAEFLRRWRGRR